MPVKEAQAGVRFTLGDPDGDRPPSPRLSEPKATGGRAPVPEVLLLSRLPSWPLWSRHASGPHRRLRTHRSRLAIHE
ncbi:hypothetical protein B5V46_10505 [Rhodovulum sp. MB263]|nr:hypothetical protein B5V46_10505 [Rhodovulum sp. MB263]